MNIYHLHRANPEHWDYDDTLAMIVAAPDERRARELAHNEPSEKSVRKTRIWLKPDETIAEQIGTATKNIEAGVILKHIRYG